jgi:hypothetical protein
MLLIAQWQTDKVLIMAFDVKDGFAWDRRTKFGSGTVAEVF